MTEREARVSVADLEPRHAAQLGDLFLSLAADPEASHFHPYPMTRQQARNITRTAASGRYIYFGAFVGGRLAGFAMLRGWDEGYAVPSFGVAVDLGYRSRGIGRILLRHAIRRARDRGAKAMILKVHGGNPGARQLYESEGFVFGVGPVEDGQYRGSLDLETLQH